MRRISRRLGGYAIVALVAACSETATPGSVSTVRTPSAEPSAATPSARSTEPTASAAENRRPVPARVADLHRTIFARPAKSVPGGSVKCLITIHDGQLSHDQFYAVVLFADGSVATWTQSSKGPVESFLAKLTQEEDARALKWLAEVAREGAAARDRFDPSTTVMGISTRPAERVETSYFAADQTPEALDRLVHLVKHRLEATNAR